MNGSAFLFGELARTVARLSLLCMFIAFAAYTVAYVILLSHHRLPAWSSAADFLEGRGRPWFRLLTFCQVCALLTPLFFVAFVAALDVSAAPRYAALTTVGLCAAVIFAALSSVYYFVQLALASGALSGHGRTGTDQLFQLNPGAAFTAVNILAWTVFFAIACLAVGPLFLGGSKASFVVAALLILNGLVCLVGAAGYLRASRTLNVIFFNGMGVAVLGFSLAGLLAL